MEDLQYNTSEVTNVKNTLAKTFLWMFMGVLATAIIAVFTYSTGLAETFVMDGTFALICIAEIVVVLVFSLLFRKLPAAVVTLLFFAYAMITGVTLSTIFYIYEVNSIIMALFASAIAFGSLAYLGYRTDRDISSLGTICMVGLILGLILSVINIFLGNAMLDIVLDWVILAIFLGFTAYDMNKIKQVLMSGEFDAEKVSVYGAMELYLDFINIFLRILSLFGNRRD